MLHKHPESCRFPHGHTRQIDVIVSAAELDQNDMVVDFKAVKILLSGIVNRLDHRMALHADDPLREAISATYPDAVLVYDRDPTTEVIAEVLYREAKSLLEGGFTVQTKAGTSYTCPEGRLKLERIRVSETPHSWAEYSEP